MNLLTRIRERMKTPKSAIIGTVLGQAIGDAMGGQTEFNKSRLVTDLGNTWGYPFPAFSDDTQMALAIADALVNERPSPTDITEDEIRATMTQVAHNFVLWDNGKWGRNNRSPGGTCMGGVHKIRSMGADKWLETGALHGKGNGGVMRVSYVGCYFWQKPELAFQFGALTSVPTHNNIESLLASGGLAFLVANSIAGKPLAASLMRMTDIMARWRDVLWTDGNGDPKEAKFAVTRCIEAYEKRHMSVAEFHRFNGNDGKAVEALAAAIHANVKYSNFADIICHLANESGDSDSTAAIGGALAGARFGYGFIRKDWRQRVETSAYLHSLANRLHQLSIGNRLLEATAQ